MPGKPGEIRQWKFIKIDIYDDEDADKSAELMEKDEWIYITHRDCILVMKKRDGIGRVKMPDRPTEPEPGARLGDLLYV